MTRVLLHLLLALVLVILFICQLRFWLYQESVLARYKAMALGESTVEMAIPDPHNPSLYHLHLRRDDGSLFHLDDVVVDPVWRPGPGVRVRFQANGRYSLRAIPTKRRKEQ